MIPSHLINPNKILYQFGGRKCISEKFKEIHYYENSPDKDVYFEMDSIIFVDLFYIKDLHILNKLKFKDNIFIFNNIHLFPEINQLKTSTKDYRFFYYDNESIFLDMLVCLPNNEKIVIVGNLFPPQTYKNYECVKTYNKDLKFDIIYFAPDNCRIKSSNFLMNLLNEIDYSDNWFTSLFNIYVNKKVIEKNFIQYYDNLYFYCYGFTNKIKEFDMNNNFHYLYFNKYKQIKLINTNSIDVYLNEFKRKENKPIETVVKTQIERIYDNRKINKRHTPIVSKPIS